MGDSLQEKLRARWLNMPVANGDLNKIVAQIIERFEAMEDRVAKLESVRPKPEDGAVPRASQRKGIR